MSSNTSNLVILARLRKSAVSGIVILVLFSLHKRAFNTFPIAKLLVGTCSLVSRNL